MNKVTRCAPVHRRRFWTFPAEFLRNCAELSWPTENGCGPWWPAMNVPREFLACG